MNKSSPSCGKPADGRRRRQKSPRRAPLQSSLGHGVSTTAKRRAAAILEVLAGVRTASQAAATLGISVNHYYLLERKALHALVAACELPPKGSAGPGLEQKLAAVQRELERCRQECLRQAALVRATQRAVGLPAVTAVKTNKEPKATNGRRPRRRQATVRALRAAQTLRKNSPGLNQADVLEQSLPERRAEDGTATDDSRKGKQEQYHGAEGKEAAGHGPC